MSKVCWQCKTENLLTELYKNSLCKSCSRARRASWRKNNPEKERLSERRQTLRKFGLTIESYNVLFSKQQGCCAGCLRHQSQFKRSLSVDHCHKTGSIRGLLCNDCNITLGKVRDDEQTLLRLSKYLETHRPELADYNTNVVELKFPKKVG